MKFVHMADCHIGSWREPKLRQLTTEAFLKAVEITVTEKADFILISGDLFNTSIPEIESLKTVVGKLKELKDKGISVYIIPGSHDFSPSGKTMLDVLESAGLCRNVVRGAVSGDRLRLSFTTDRTGAKITGMLGKKGMLEKKFYEDLDREPLEKEKGFKVFMLHTALTELKSKELESMDSAPVSLLPKGFDYYAAGHVHERIDKKVEGYGRIVFPGPLFPNNFRELESLRYGGIYIYSDGKAEFRKIELRRVTPIDLEGSSPEEFESGLLGLAKDGDFKDAIVPIRLRGALATGKVSDIDFKTIFDEFYSRGAYFMLKNTSGVSSKEFEEIKIHEENVEDIESVLIEEHLGNLPDMKLDAAKEKELTERLMQAMHIEKKEGERNSDFEERLISGVDQVLKGA